MTYLYTFKGYHFKLLFLTSKSEQSTIAGIKTTFAFLKSGRVYHTKQPRITYNHFIIQKSPIVAECCKMQVNFGEEDLFIDTH